MKHWSTPCCRSYIALTQSGWSVSSDSNRYVYLPPAADVCKFSSLSHDVDQSAARGRKQGRSSALACFVGVGMNISTLSGDVFFLFARTYCHDRQSIFVCTNFVAHVALVWRRGILLIAEVPCRNCFGGCCLRMGFMERDICACRSSFYLALC